MLTASHLTKRYGDVLAVHDVSFSVAPGRITGFVGGNGAGKTTTMRMLMGLLTPDSGSALWGEAPLTREQRTRIGYMPEERGLYPKQKVLDQLTYLGTLHGMTRHDARTSATGLLEGFGLADRMGDKLEELSLGNQQRVQVTAAVMFNPLALILDEPFSGLDPDAVHAMSDVLLERAHSGVPVLFSSHQLDLVERLCDDLVVLKKGSVALQGTAEQLRDTSETRHRLVCEPDAGWVREMPGVQVHDVDGPTAMISCVNDDTVSRIAAEAVRRGSLRELAVLRPTLSEIYREATA